MNIRVVNARLVQHHVSPRQI